VDAPDTFVHSVIRPARKVDLAKLRKNFQHEIVSIFSLDVRYQGQQQIPRPRFLGGKRQPPGVLQFGGDRHGCIISPLSPTWRAPEAADV
jgi:hypothetical protein